MKPTFSIIIPTLNEEKFLPNLLQSIVAQRYRDYEVIIADGNSQDTTVQVANSFVEQLSSLKVVVLERCSLPWQRNQGAQHASGKYYLFIDADTVLLPYALERLADWIGSKRKISHFTPWFAVDGDSTQDALLTLIINATIEGGIMTKRPAALGPFSGFSSKAFHSIKGYDERLEWGEDGEISRRAYEAGYTLAILRETLAVYSLRRFKKQGTLKTLRVYVRNIFQVLLTKKSPTSVPGYLMGGHLYTEDDKQRSRSLLRQFQSRLNTLTKELLGSSSEQ
jgi:glycosyltransferase involved in cell wall biosynthesis